jgi:membrane protease YdiL (CAAX protease family)
MNSKADHRLGMRVLAAFAAVFAATWVVQLILGVGVKLVMDRLGAAPDVRTYLGATLSRGGIIAAVIVFSDLALRKAVGMRLAEGAFGRHAGWRRDLLFGGLLAFGVMAAVFLVEVTQGWLIIETQVWHSQPPDAWLRSVWLSLLTNLVPGVGEEVMFRGTLLTGLVQAWGRRAGLAVMVALFALPHLTVSGAAETHWLLFTALLSLPGLVLGWAYLRAGSLWLPMGIHFAWDLAYDVFDLTGGSHPGLFGAVTRQQGPEWIVGTAFGVEVGLAGVLVAALVGGGVWLWTRRPR